MTTNNLTLYIPTNQTKTTTHIMSFIGARGRHNANSIRSSMLPHTRDGCSRRTLATGLGSWRCCKCIHKNQLYARPCWSCWGYRSDGSRCQHWRGGACRLVLA